MLEEKPVITQTEKRLSPIIDFFVNISTAIIVFLVIYFFIAQPHQVEGSSMVPNFYSGDYVLTEKITQHLNGIKTGDVVVFHYPKNPSYDYIKRVIAVPGDDIKLNDGRVYVNGEILEEPYLVRNLAKLKNKNLNGVMGTMTTAHSFLKEDQDYKVEEDELIVMGDNRLESSDSREWGTVPEGLVVGKVFFRYWPLSRFGFVNN